MNHVKDVILEPNPKTVYGVPIPKMEGLSKCRDWRCSPSECHLTNIDLVLDHRKALKPTWKDGQMSREVHKTIVKKVVDKVTSTVENTPPTKEKIDIYMTYSKEKLNKLVQVKSAPSIITLVLF